MENTKERIRQREYFVFLWRDEIKALIKSNDIFKWSARMDFVENHARGDLYYEDGTKWQTIWQALHNDYNRLFNTSL